MALWISEDWPTEAIIHGRILNAIDPEGLRASSGSVIQLKHAMIGSSAERHFNLPLRSPKGKNDAERRLDRLQKQQQGW